MAYYEITFKPSAKKELDKIPDRKMQRKIHEIISHLKQNPRAVTGCKKIFSHQMPHHYRIRQGDYRVIFAITEKDRTVRILKVSHRKDAYKTIRAFIAT